MKQFTYTICAALIAASLPLTGLSAVSVGEAAALKTTLTPAGGEMSANKDGSIPAYTGGFKEPYTGTVGGRRPDPFAADKPLFSITQQNVAQYADKLSVGTLELLKKHADYRVDVYKTVRTARMLPAVADRSFQNATKTKLVNRGDERVPEGYQGGVPFPIAKTGEEAMFNHILRVRGDTHLVFNGRTYLVTADGKRTIISETEAMTSGPTGFSDFKAEGWNGTYDMIRVNTLSPVIRAGEQLVVRENLDHAKSEIYAYLPGQRRVRRLPALCCDSPSAATGGVANVDDTAVWSGRLDRFNWKLVGKKELFIPYNNNRFNVPTKDFDVVGERFLKPDFVRWELHRVWVVEASLKNGQRHTSPKSVYYLDEDTWQAVIADRWDAKGQLWKHSFVLPQVFPDLAWTSGVQFGFYDLLSNTFLINNIMNEKKSQVRRAPELPASTWQSEAMAGAGVR
jgi:Protein of unknown function (DUF1329)